MTADELQRIATRLGNGCWTRHWLHWNYPREAPWLMAINCREHDGSPTSVYEGDMERAGFRKEEREGHVFWVTERTEADGRPFTSKA